jgi:hypothetical protein
MTVEQAAAHIRMVNSLRARTVAADEWLDQPENWQACNRPLSPAEKMYLSGVDK